MSKQTAPSPHALRVSDLKQNRATVFALRPESDVLEALAQDLDLLGLRKLSFGGEVTAQGTSDWLLSAKLGATVVQPCGVTLEPVTTRIDVPVRRTYLSAPFEEDAPEVEMPEDDSTEPLGQWIDPEQVMTEALILALPLYPRSAEAELGEKVYAAPGVTPMRDEDARPFAGLAAFRKQLSDPEDDTS
ncbi:MAG: DUF177 domain-containing protein [Paracoccaceae bacterium]|nr:DUF177 domain-containing protein [Paracoccaceae bacterium]